MPIFDESKFTPWSEKRYTRALSHSGKTIHLVGLRNQIRMLIR